MGQVYEEHKDEDGFLYIAYSGENTFGMWTVNLELSKIFIESMIYCFVLIFFLNIISSFIYTN